MVSAWNVGDTRGSGIVSSAADVLWMSVVRGMRGVGGVCEMCMCLARGGVVGEWMRGLGLFLGLYQFCGNRGSVGRVFGLRWCRWGVGRGLGLGVGGVVWCYVCVSCESGLSVYMAGPSICIL